MGLDIIPVLGDLLSALTQEAWGRWMLLIGAFGINSIIAGLTGVFLIEGVVETAFDVLGFPDFVIPKINNISLMLPIVLFMPLVMYALYHRR